MYAQSRSPRSGAERRHRPPKDPFRATADERLQRLLVDLLALAGGRWRAGCCRRGSRRRGSTTLGPPPSRAAKAGCGPRYAPGSMLFPPAVLLALAASVVAVSIGGALLQGRLPRAPLAALVAICLTFALA